MRILHVIPSLSPTEGGPSHVLPLMVAGLRQRGHDVVVATTHGRGEPALSAAASQYSFPRQSEFYKISFPLRHWVAAEVARFDVVHIHALFSFSSIEAAKLAAKSRTPYVIRPLGVLNQFGVRTRRPFLKRLSLTFREAPVIRKAGAMHFTSEAERDEAELLGIEMNSRVIPLGIGVPDTIPLDRSGSGNSVVFLSRIDPKKNIESLLKGWSRIEEDTKREWTLKIAGSGEPDYLKRLQHLAGRLGIAGQVDWCGFVEGGNKQRLLSEAGIFILPSFSENFGIAAVEAMGAGVPSILTSGVAVGPEAARDRGCLLTETSSESIALALTRLMNSPQDRLNLAQRGHKFVRSHYSVPAMTEALELLYQDLLTNAQSS